MIRDWFVIAYCAKYNLNSTALEQDSCFYVFPYNKLHIVKQAINRCFTNNVMCNLPSSLVSIIKKKNRIFQTEYVVLSNKSTIDTLSRIHGLRRNQGTQYSIHQHEAMLELLEAEVRCPLSGTTQRNMALDRMHQFFVQREIADIRAICQRLRKVNLHCLFEKFGAYSFLV